MSFMAIALISVLGAGLLGLLAVLVQYLLKQNAARAADHTDAMSAIAAQGQRNEELHSAAMTAIHDQGLRMIQHAHELHREAMAAIREQGKDLREHSDKLHAEAMAAIAVVDREHREHREKLHGETMSEIGALHRADAALSERTAVLETLSGG